MNTHVEMLRFFIAEWLIGQAFNVMPNGREKREMAIFLQHSWIGRTVNYPAAGTQDEQREWLQREFARKVAEGRRK